MSKQDWTDALFAAACVAAFILALVLAKIIAGGF